MGKGMGAVNRGHRRIHVAIGLERKSGKWLIGFRCPDGLPTAVEFNGKIDSEAAARAETQRIFGSLGYVPVFHSVKEDIH